MILLLSLLAIARATPGAERSAVKIEREGDGWRLRRNGEPFLIKGACGMTHLDALAAAGANSVRFWRVDERSLDQADRLGLSVLVGLPLGKPRTGFDYADMLSLPEDLVRQGWKRPYLVTEFGPRGHWQVAKTGWGARLEDTSTQKAEFYRRAYEHAVKDRPQCLGAFAFLWGWKMEKTHTWYGMLLQDGSRTGAADVMRFLWSGRWPTNHCPTIASANVPVLAK